MAGRAVATLVVVCPGALVVVAPIVVSIVIGFSVVATLLDA